MRFNVPLLPIRVEIRWRPILPFRLEVDWRILPPLRFSTRGLMLAVVLVASFFALVDRSRRLHEAASYHHRQLSEAERSRPATWPPVRMGPTPLEMWHEAKRREYQAAASPIDSVGMAVLMAFPPLAAVVVAGRLLNWMARRARRPSEDAPGL